MGIVLLFIFCFRFIDAKELRPMCEMVGINPNPQAIKDIMKYADLNSDGKISYREFVLAVERSQK